MQEGTADDVAPLLYEMPILRYMWMKGARDLTHDWGREGRRRPTVGFEVFRAEQGHQQMS